MFLFTVILLASCTAIYTEHSKTNCFDEIAHLMRHCQDLRQHPQQSPFFQNSPQPVLQANSQKKCDSPVQIESKSYHNRLSDVCQKLELLLSGFVSPLLKGRSQFMSSPTTYEARYPSMANSMSENENKNMPQNEEQNNFSVREDTDTLLNAGRSGAAFSEISSIGPRIIGGQVADPDEFPYQVALHKLDIFVCGSSLISQHFVITAAHCLQRVLPNELWFRVGSDSLIQGGQTYRVADFIVHNKYTNGDNDIGLIRSINPVEFGPGVKAIALPLKNDPFILPGTHALTSGWGATENTHGSPTYRLHKLQLKIVSRKLCRNRIMATVKTISSRQICTIAPIHSGTCFGDSGGPLVVNKKLVGIVSWGSPCAIGDPDVYTNVQFYLPWIYQQMKELSQNKDFLHSVPEQVPAGAYEYGAESVYF